MSNVKDLGEQVEHLFEEISRLRKKLDIPVVDRHLQMCENHMYFIMWELGLEVPLHIAQMLENK